MDKPAFFMWPIAWIVFTGALVTIALLVPAAEARMGLWIALSAVAGGLLAVPVSMSASKTFRE